MAQVESVCCALRLGLLLEFLFFRRLGLLLRDLRGALRLAVSVVLRDARCPILLRLARRGDARKRLRFEAAGALEALLRDQPLDLRRLLLLSGLAADDILANVVLLGQVEDLADVRSAFRTKAAGLIVIREPGDFLLPLLCHDELHDREIRRCDATPNALALARTLTTRAIRLHTLTEEETNAIVRQHTLHHREALLVVPTRNLEDVAFELITKRVGRNLGGHALLVERQELAVVVDLDALLQPRARVADVQLHGSGKGGLFAP